MQYRIIGLILIAMGVGIIWYVKPAANGKYRYPKRYEKFVSNFAALVVTGLIGLGVPFLFFGAPGFETLPGSGQ